MPTFLDARGGRVDELNVPVRVHSLPGMRPHSSRFSSDLYLSDTLAEFLSLPLPIDPGLARSGSFISHLAQAKIVIGSARDIPVEISRTLPGRGAV